MRKHSILKLQFILWSFLIFIGSANAKEIQCSLKLASHNYIVNLTPLSDQSYRADIVASDNLNKKFNLLGQYQVSETRQNFSGNETSVYSDRQRQFALYISTGTSFLTAVLNDSSFLGEKLSGPLNCQIINKEKNSNNCCSICNPNCHSGLPVCPIRPGSCH